MFILGQRHKPPKVGDDWHIFHKSRIRGHWKRQLARAVYSFVPPPAHDSHVVDLGCGTSPLSSAYDTLWCCDRDDEALNFLRARNVSAHYALQDLHFALNYGSGRFDVVLCIEVIEHVGPYPLMSEIYRILRPGGYAIIATPDYSTRTWKLVEAAYQTVWPESHCRDHDYPQTRTSLKREADEVGLLFLEETLVMGCDLAMMFQKAE